MSSTILVWVPLKADPEKQTWELGAYLGDGPGKQEKPVTCAFLSWWLSLWAAEAQ